MKNKLYICNVKGAKKREEQQKNRGEEKEVKERGKENKNKTYVLTLLSYTGEIACTWAAVAPVRANAREITCMWAAAAPVHTAIARENHRAGIISGRFPSERSDGRIPLYIYALVDRGCPHRTRWSAGQNALYLSYLLFLLYMFAET